MQDEKNHDFIQATVTDFSSKQWVNQVNLFRHIGNKISFHQIKGLGYEHDFVQHQRSKLTQLFRIVKLNPRSIKQGDDVRVIGFFKRIGYELKTNMKNIKKRLNINYVAPIEDQEIVQKIGQKGQVYSTKAQIARRALKRERMIQSGKTISKYSPNGILKASFRSGIISFGIVVSLGLIKSYQLYRKSIITKEEFLNNALMSGAKSSLSSTLTSVVLIPITIGITTIGASSLLTIPVSFFLTKEINKVIEPLFKKSKSKDVLKDAVFIKAVYSNETML